MKIVSVVGARPQFVKAAVICKAAARSDRPINHRLIHTGQHYDYGMSQVFFDELNIPAPDHNLETGSGSHGAQTGEMLRKLEPVLASEQPDWVLLYGDTNSTLAGAVVASKMGLRTAHVEAGLRSYNRRMPEEINRIVADHLSDLLLCPTAVAVDNLRREGLAEKAVITGDVMLDAALAYRKAAGERAGDLAARWLENTFALATLHRAENTDDRTRLTSILNAIDRISREICPVLLPLHPRTAKAIAEWGWMPQAVTIIQPVTYLDMLLLEDRARFILTDSGGVQKEAYFVQTPCITLRDETEWEETLANECNVLAGADEERIYAAATRAGQAGPWGSFYGTGDAGARILEALQSA